VANLTSSDGQLTEQNPRRAPRLPGADPGGGILLGGSPFLGYITVGLLVAQKTSTGITPVFQAAAGAGDSYVNTGQQTLWVHNNSAAPITVTIKAQNKCNVGPGYLHDIVTVVAAASGGAPGEASMGPAAFNIFNDANGLVQIAYSTAIGVTVALTAA
jgi:hypothetical protein